MFPHYASLVCCFVRPPCLRVPHAAGATCRVQGFATQPCCCNAVHRGGSDCLDCSGKQPVCPEHLEPRCNCRPHSKLPESGCSGDILPATQFVTCPRHATCDMLSAMQFLMHTYYSPATTVMFAPLALWFPCPPISPHGYPSLPLFQPESRDEPLVCSVARQGNKFPSVHAWMTMCQYVICISHAVATHCNHTA